jgi:hypothetical protein
MDPIKIFDRELARINVNKPDFEKKERVHDWRNYVPVEWVEHWEEFSEREKKIIALMAEFQAGKEEWD